MNLKEVRFRLAELVEKLPLEVDIDIEELLAINEVIMASGSEMTPSLAKELKTNIDEIQNFVSHQREVLHKLLNGVTTGKKVVGRYGKTRLKTESRFVYRQA
jgi:hypothetical protein